MNYNQTMDIKSIVEQSKASIEKKDLEILLRILSSINPGVILEIGTWEGYSAMIWIQTFFPKNFITIEIDSIEKHPDRRQAGNNYGDRHYLWGHDSHDKKTFNEVKTIFGKDKIDFLFVDGNHSYEGVKKDWEMYSPLVRKGGIVALHDCCYHADKTEEVDIFWSELKTKHNYIEIKSSPRSTGMGIIFI